MNAPIVVAINTMTNEVTLKVFVNDASVVQIGSTLEYTKSMLVARARGESIHFHGANDGQRRAVLACLDRHNEKFGSVL
jgi:hypothetical protein